LSFSSESFRRGFGRRRLRDDYLLGNTVDCIGKKKEEVVHDAVEGQTRNFDKNRRALVLVWSTRSNAAKGRGEKAEGKKRRKNESTTGLQEATW